MYTIPYYSAAEQEWAAVTIPKIIRDDPVDPAQFDKFLDRPLRTGYPCHQQAVERAVALMSAAKLKCVHDEAKSGHQGVISAERKKNPGKAKRRRLDN